MGAATAAALIGMAAALIRVEEGLSLVAYDDATGRPLRAGAPVVGLATTGYGHRCHGPGRITRARADALLRDDLAAAETAAHAYAGEETWGTLGEPRRAALVDLAFNVGAAGLARFTLLREALAAGDWGRAAAEIRDSRLAPARKARLAAIVGTGEVSRPQRKGRLHRP